MLTSGDDVNSSDTIILWSHLAGLPTEASLEDLLRLHVEWTCLIYFTQAQHQWDVWVTTDCLTPCEQLNTKCGPYENYWNKWYFQRLLQTARQNVCWLSQITMRASSSTPIVLTLVNVSKWWPGVNLAMLNVLCYLHKFSIMVSTILDRNQNRMRCGP